MVLVLNYTQGIMKIKEIPYTGNTDLINCESEPIHLPGTIQPYGALLAMYYARCKLSFVVPIVRITRL